MVMVVAPPPVVAEPAVVRVVLVVLVVVELLELLELLPPPQAASPEARPMTAAPVAATLVGRRTARSFRSAGYHLF